MLSFYPQKTLINYFTKCMFSVDRDSYYFCTTTTFDLFTKLYTKQPPPVPMKSWTDYKLVITITVTIENRFVWTFKVKFKKKNWITNNGVACRIELPLLLGKKFESEKWFISIVIIQFPRIEFVYKNLTVIAVYQIGLNTKKMPTTDFSLFLYI